MRISQKEKMQLGYSRSPHSPSRDPNIDFSDVFGGPPRRASMQEMQNRYSDDSYDNDTWRRDGSDERVNRSSWSNNPSERPVFGDEITSRRRYQSEDFFGDIFRGDQSQCSSPRLGVRDPSSSSPGSRVLSPSRSLPPGAVPLGSPAQFSLPARLASSQSSSTSMSRISGQDVFQAGDAFSAYRRSPLAGEEGKKDVNLEGSGGGGIQISNGGNQFHFSIHKWASKGMPLVMSLGKRNSLRAKIQLERSLSLNDSGGVESDTLVGEIQPAGVSNDECLSFKVHVVSSARKESDQIVDKPVTDAPNSRPNNNVESEKPTLSENSTSKKSDPKLNYNKLEGKSGNDNAIPEVRVNKSDKNGSGEVVRKFKGKEQSGFKGDNKRNNINYPKSLGNDTPEEKMKESKLNDRVREKEKEDKGKVKEFVKIFNQEPPVKPAADIDGKIPSSRRRNADESRASSKSTLSSSKTDGKMQGSDVNSGLDSSPKVVGNPTLSTEKQFEAENVPEPYHSSSIETENLGSTIGSASDGHRASSASIDVTFDSFVIEEIQETQDKPSENSEDNEDIRAYESKILKWSKGKEGNIRALLSTLQYVLWPNSGWKPVPLVNIIEANAVKRSYQRALLYLHPDKLQQKGAAPHQKFIAAKVFDILQEAWDHFNTLGSL